MVTLICGHLEKLSLWKVSWVSKRGDFILKGRHGVEETVKTKLCRQYNIAASCWMEKPIWWNMVGCQGNWEMCSEESVKFDCRWYMRKVTCYGMVKCWVGIRRLEFQLVSVTHSLCVLGDHLTSLASTRLTWKTTVSSWRPVDQRTVIPYSKFFFQVWGRSPGYWLNTTRSNWLEFRNHVLKKLLYL